MKTVTVMNQLMCWGPND